MKRMNRFFSLTLLAVAFCGCASSDRMVRMSGGVFDEYSAPKSSRIRSEKYQQVTRELASSTRSNRVEVAGMDDTLVNIWPFFFRSNAYWTILWPFIDKDPYGFAVRPIYNHEGDDYSILFPLSAWNPAAGHGWVTLFGWNKHGFGFVPLSWQWKDGLSGGAYYTPLFIYAYDGDPLHYTVANGKCVSQRWSRTDHSLFCFLVLDEKKTEVESGPWGWIYRGGYPELRNEWNYRFDGKRPFPENETAFRDFQAEIFKGLPRRETRIRGFVPLWVNESYDNGDHGNRFLLFAGNERRGKNFSWDVFGPLLASYKDEYASENDRFRQGERRFTSAALLTHFSVERTYERTETWKKLEAVDRAAGWGAHSFNQRRPAVEDALKKLDPRLKLPPTVVDNDTFRLFADDLWKKYRFPVREERIGTVLPLFYFDIGPEADCWAFPALITGWKKREQTFKFFSLPLLSYFSRSPKEDVSTVFTPLAYYAKTVRRERRDYPVYSRDRLSVSEGECAELNDRYALCGLFYRGRFGFNVVKDGSDIRQVEKLRQYLLKLPGDRRRLDERLKNIDKETALNDRWQTKGEIERLKKLIRYEELKLDREKLARDEADHSARTDDALKIAGKLGIALSLEALGDGEKSVAAADELMEKYTELRRYEDIGNGLFFRKERFFNGDYNWHFMRILAGGEKTGERESTHILHLLYRYRREGRRSETVYFPFVSTVHDGDDYRFSFLWRVFSLSRRGGKTGGHILFIPFGNE